MNIRDALTAAGVDYEQTLQRFSGNEALLLRFILKFPQDETYRQLKTAVEQNDHAQILTAAHTLKGVCANLGFSQLSDTCAQLVADLRAQRYDRTGDFFDTITKQYQRAVQAAAEIG